MSEKACKKCGLLKSLSEFHTHPKMRDGHLNACMACQNEAARLVWVLRVQDSAYRQKERDRIAAWRAAHPEAWKAARDRANANARVSGTAARASVARKQREKSGSIGPIALRNILDRDGMNCSICTLPIEDERTLTFDHTIPLSRGGTHSEENLHPAHGRCNSWKGNRLPGELAGLVVPPPGKFDAWQERRLAQANASRSLASKAWFANATPEQKRDRGEKISRSKTGKKFKPGHKAGGARIVSQEVIDRRSDTNKRTWANKTPEEIEAWKQKCRTIKRAAAAASRDFERQL
jgi:hypothetical protein